MTFWELGIYYIQNHSKALLGRLDDVYLFDNLVEYTKEINKGDNNV